MLKEQNVYKNLEAIAAVKDTSTRTSLFRELLVSNRAIATLIQYIFHPDIEFFPFDKSVAEDLVVEIAHNEDSPTYRAIRSLGYLVPSKYPQLDEKKRIRIFRDMLESVNAADRKILTVGILERKLPFRNLGRKYVSEAAPELFPA